MLYETPGSTVPNVGVTARGIRWDGIRGGVTQAAASLQCVEGRPCGGLEAVDVNLRVDGKRRGKDGGGDGWLCSHATLSEVENVTPAPGSSCSPAPPAPAPPTPSAGCPATIYNATETTGSPDLSSSHVTRLALCCAECASTGGCGAFTFMPAPDGGSHKGMNCWLHPAQGTMLAKASDRIAGVMH